MSAKPVQAPLNWNQIAQKMSQRTGRSMTRQRAQVIHARACEKFIRKYIELFGLPDGLPATYTPPTKQRRSSTPPSNKREATL